MLLRLGRQVSGLRECTFQRKQAILKVAKPGVAAGNIVQGCLLLAITDGWGLVSAEYAMSSDLFV